jgi:hypothetical protein
MFRADGQGERGKAFQPCFVALWSFFGQDRFGLWVLPVFECRFIGHEFLLCK